MVRTPWVFDSVVWRPWWDDDYATAFYLKMDLSVTAIVTVTVTWLCRSVLPTA